MLLQSTSLHARPACLDFAYCSELYSPFLRVECVKMSWLKGSLQRENVRVYTAQQRSGDGQLSTRSRLVKSVPVIMMMMMMMKTGNLFKIARSWQEQHMQVYKLRVLCDCGPDCYEDEVSSRRKECQSAVLRWAVRVMWCVCRRRRGGRRMKGTFMNEEMAGRRVGSESIPDRQKLSRRRWYETAARTAQHLLEHVVLLPLRTIMQ